MERTARPLLVKVLRPLRLTNYAPKSQTILPANFYPSNNTLIQALLVLLITNMISMGKTWSDLLKLCAASSSSSPLSNQMDPVVSLTYRSIFPPSPTETQLKCSPPHLYKYDSWLRILGSDKGSPELCPPLPRRLPPPTLHYTVL